MRLQWKARRTARGMGAAPHRPAPTIYASPKCRAWTLLAWTVALLLEAAVIASDLRVLPPAPQTIGAVQLQVVGSDHNPLDASRAERISILRSQHVAMTTTQWAPIEGLRSLSGGVLRIELRTSELSGAPWFFVARENPLLRTITVSNAAGFGNAMASVSAGTRVLLSPGTYPGGFFFANLRGEPDLPIIVSAAQPQNPPLIQGGANGIQLSDPSWVEISDLVFVGATGNGLNIDDGGSFDTPAHHITLRRLRISQVGPEGNRDGIKLSGVVDFRVEGCTVERWGSAGSAIDMVGCHRGIIESNSFRHTAAAAGTGANGVQAKGGTRDVAIRRNRFEHAGARCVNIGGSTGLEFFRPPLVAGQAHAEAENIRVEGNILIGGTASVAFVGVDGAIVRFNTIFQPERWAMRILQETTAAGFVPCRNGAFTDNIVAFLSTQWSSGGVNIGPGTAPGTFQFARNWWYCLDQPARSRPALPVPEVGGVVGQSPQFRDASSGDVRLQPGSPAGAAGAEALID